MTSDQPHPPAPILAELVEGVLDTTTGAGVEAHVRNCPTCTDSVEQLGDLSAALRALPAELPTPEHVSARVRAALAAERATTVDAVGRPRSRTDEHGGATVAWFRRRLPQALAAAASVSVIGLIGYVAVTSSTGPDDDQSAAEMAGDAAGASDSATAPHVAREDSTELGDDTASEVDRTALASAIDLVWQTRSELAPGCGQRLADDIGQPLIGSDTVGAGVLVVLEDVADDQLGGWVLQTCDSPATEALSSPVVISVPE